MKHLLRPNTCLGLAMAAGVGVALLAPHSARAQATEITQILQESSPLLLTGSSPGYLGVLLGDVDSDSAAKLKLKDVRGAVVTLIDHDAPAGQMGLKLNDVILELNGQQIEGAEQLRRMLHEIPPGHNVSMLVSRDGNTLTLAAQMGDRKKIVDGFWTRLGHGELFGSTGPGLSILGGGDTPSAGPMKFNVFGSTLKVGALVEPLTSQMAEYLGVQSGLMVKQVARKTEADAAGLKAFDVILKVGADPIATIADWERSLRENQGKPVQLTVLRDKKQQTLTLKVDSKRTKGELDMEELFPSDDCTMMAEAEPGELYLWGNDANADELRKQAESLRDQLQAGGLQQFTIDPRQAEELQKQGEQLRDSLKGFDFKMDPQQLEQFKQQMDQWQKNFSPDNFKLDQNQLDELKPQMDEWRERSQPQVLQLAPQWI
jgi:serine protease Do